MTSRRCTSSFVGFTDWLVAFRYTSSAWLCRFAPEAKAGLKGEGKGEGLYCKEEQFK